MLNTRCSRTDLAGAKAPFLPPDPACNFYRNISNAMNTLESLGWTANVPGSPGPQQVPVSIHRMWLGSHPLTVIMGSAPHVLQTEVH